MEEEKLPQTETKDKSKNVIIAILVILIVAIIGAVVYFTLIKKDDKPVDNNGGNNQIVDDNTQNDDSGTDINNQPVDTNKIALYVNDEVKESINVITLGNTSFEFKLVELDDGLKSDLYLNNQKVETIDYQDVEVVVVDKYLFVQWPGAQAGSLALGYVDENGQYFPIFSAGVEAINVYYENGKFYCETSISTEEAGYDTKKVELVIDGSNVKLEEIN